jgi:hypothetical protein
MEGMKKEWKVGRLGGKGGKEREVYGMCVGVSGVDMEVWKGKWKGSGQR